MGHPPSAERDVETLPCVHFLVQVRSVNDSWRNPSLATRELTPRPHHTHRLQTGPASGSDIVHVPAVQAVRHL